MRYRRFSTPPYLKPKIATSDFTMGRKDAKKVRWTVFAERYSSS